MELFYSTMRITYKYYSFNVYIKRILFIFFIFSNTVVNAQEKDIASIDKNLELSKQEFINLNYTTSAASANKALELSKTISYSKGILLSNIAIAKVLSEIGIYKSALKYLEDAEREPYIFKHINAQVEIYRLRGRIYTNLEMYEISNFEFYKQLKFSQKIKDSTLRKRAIFWAHQNLAISFSNTNQYDSVWSHLTTQKKIIESLPKEFLPETYYDLSSTYASFAEEYIRRGEYIAARHNLNQSLAILKNNKSSYLHNVYNIYGNLEDAVGRTLEAEKYYKLALSNAIELKNKSAENYALSVLADYFIKKNLNEIETKDYIVRHRKLSDSLDNINKNATNLVLNQVLNKKNEAFNNKTNNYWIGFSVLGTLLLSILLFLWKSNSFKKIKLKTLEEELNKKELLHTDFVKQNNQNDHNKFNDIIELAKSNNPQFIILFKDLYPDFIIKLRKLDPNIKTSEISFCAMIFLNFSTKEISDYTFVTIRAVQIRKNRLRKKHSIDSEQDLSIWMGSL